MSKKTLTDQRLYRIWKNIKTRCYNKNNPKYKNYGNKNITMCKEWVNNFEKFREWALNNGYSNNLTIDRINNSGNYQPSNCRWVDQKTQQNNRSNNRVFTHNGETRTLQQWCDLFNLKSKTVEQRILRGIMDFEKIFSEKDLRKKGA